MGKSVFSEHTPLHVRSRSARVIEKLILQIQVRLPKTLPTLSLCCEEENQLVSLQLVNPTPKHPSVPIRYSIAAFTILQILQSCAILQRGKRLGQSKKFESQDLKLVAHLDVKIVPSTHHPIHVSVVVKFVLKEILPVDVVSFGHPWRRRRRRRCLRR